jgi:hypothetical protein
MRANLKTHSTGSMSRFPSRTGARDCWVITKRKMAWAMLARPFLVTYCSYLHYKWSGRLDLNQRKIRANSNTCNL